MGFILRLNINLQMDSTGSLELITGPMFSGKSTEILRRLLIDNAIGLRVLYINHSRDIRGSDQFSTHNPLYKERLSGKIKFLSTNNIKSVSVLDNYDVIGIDEAQFFSDLVGTVSLWVDVYHKKVIVAGLTSDFQRCKFGKILDLEPLSDTFTKLHSYCQRCAKSKKIVNALFTYRTAISKEQISVGGAESYMPVCRKCYHQLKAE